MTRQEIEQRAKAFDSKLKKHPTSSGELQNILSDFAEELIKNELSVNKEPLKSQLEILAKKQINEVARDYATKCHTETNHLYDGKPYRTHLNLVVTVMEQFSHLIPQEDRRLVQAACWVHDVIEDCRQTYNDVKAECGEQVAEIVYALTNEKGKSRKERANDKYYKGILQVKYAPFVKLCDRIANMEYSKQVGGRKFEMYCKENDDFVRKLYKPEYDEMVSYLLSYTRYIGV